MSAPIVLTDRPTIVTKFLTVDQPTDTLAAPVNADNVRRLADMASSMAKGAA